MANGSWLTVCGESGTGLADVLEKRVAEKREQGKFSINDQKYIEKVTLAATKGVFSTTPARLEMLRRLCAIYRVEPKAREISSHRPFVGKVIVTVKRILFQMIQSLLGPTFTQQCDFNAAVIYLLTDLCNEADERWPGAERSR